MDSETISEEACRISKKEALPKNRLKIRRSFSCKISKVSTTASNSHANSTSQQIRQRIQPLIIHTLDPKIIVTEPCNFMWVVQRLTGSLNTRSSLCKMKKKMKEERQLQTVHADGTKATSESETKLAKTSLTYDNYTLPPKSASNLTSSDDNTASTQLKEGICDTDDASPRGPFPSFEPGFAADEWDFCAFSFNSHHAYDRGAHDIEPFSADSFTYPMVLSPREIVSMSFLKDVPSCLPTLDEVI